MQVPAVLPPAGITQRAGATQPGPSTVSQVPPSEASALHVPIAVPVAVPVAVKQSPATQSARVPSGRPPHGIPLPTKTKVMQVLDPLGPPQYRPSALSQPGSDCAPPQPMPTME